MTEEGAARSLPLPRLRWLPQLSVDMDLPRITLLPYPRKSTPNWTSRPRCCVEEMELLALAWLVDPHAWREIINAHTPDAIRGGFKANESTMPTYVITLPSRDTTTRSQMWDYLNGVFTPHNDSRLSEEFRQAKARLLAQETRESVLEAAANLQITVELVYQPFLENLHPTILAWEKSTRDSPRRCKLAGLSYSDPNTVTRKTMARIEAQVEHGLMIENALLGLLGTKAALSPRATDQFFTNLLGEYGAKRLRVRHLTHHRWVMEAFLSKLVETLYPEASETGKMSVFTLTIDGFYVGNSVATRRSALLWWFYGLFSQDARHSIHKMEFPWLGSCIPSLEEMRWFLEILQTHKAPRPELFLVDALIPHTSCSYSPTSASALATGTASRLSVSSRGQIVMSSCRKSTPRDPGVVAPLTVVLARRNVVTCRATSPRKTSSRLNSKSLTSFSPNAIDWIECWSKIHGVRGAFSITTVSER